jgi:pimeloyl-ACP methyl ester carboxylesterase
MTDLTPDDIDAAARDLVEEASKPSRRVRPRLARKLADGEDVEVDTPNGPVMAWRLGVGPATLLVHGWEDDNALWSPLIDACAELGRAVVAFDLPGHGFSPSEAFSLEAAGQAVLAVGAALGPIDSIVGHSFGCPASLYALSHGLSVHRAVFIASPFPRTKERESWVDDWAARQRKRGEDPAVVDRAMVIMAERAKTFAHDQVVTEADLGALAAKALIIHSMDDDQCPVGNAYALNDHLPGSELVLVDDLGHRLVAQDAVVIERVINFVEDYG